MTSAATAPPRRRSRLEPAGGYWAYLIPGAIGFAAVVLIPFGMNIYLSLTQYRGVGTPVFIGLDNYARLAADPTFWASFVNSIVFIFAMAIIPTALGVFVAAVLFDFIAPRFGTRVSSIMRAMFYLPQILPIAVAGVLWKWIYQPEYGVGNSILDSIGLGALRQNWLGDSDTAIWAVVNVLIWLQIGYTVVLFMAGLSRVDPALYEAAELDGAGWMTRFRMITLNQLRPEIAVVIITTSVAALKVFAPIFVLTKGGPGTSTMVPSYFSFSSFFTTSQVGYGAAVATVLALVITVIAVGLLLFQTRNTEGFEK
ncbi:carbohydrate ABC transporter permease [Mycetocola reblochoni]|uniref:N-Acetyl-D-glucosamine ABC transport system, permease protein 1 n=2 Tax=Mycetocola reblochoni TaxID=331618 RepID=A0A1R4K9W6_9MICO|nr:sugar ABC transporter permease [Mycetocola reblochoni]RLP71178.1 sugar ABC transporter permease [Mycetocola reblochoni]SJN41100.1 N-Acetyl-D-glucosamine ABC transport system, permease protein 1 [Mycetocola reblochoni REB411]